MRHSYRQHAGDRFEDIILQTLDLLMKDLVEFEGGCSEG